MMTKNKKILYGLILFVALIIAAGVYLLIFQTVTINVLLGKNAEKTEKKIATIQEFSPEKFPEYIYGRVQSLTKDSLVIKKIERYKEPNQTESLYTIKFSPETIFIYQEVTANDWGTTAFVAQEGRIDDIKKDWFVKIEYAASDVRKPVANKDYAEIVASKVHYSKEPPFLQ